MNGNKGFWLIVIYFALSVYLMPMLPLKQAQRENAAIWATSASLVEKASFDISWLKPLTGEFRETLNVNERVYSKEAPGMAILGAPFYAITRLFVGVPNERNIPVSWFIIRFFLSSLPLLFLAYWLYKHDADEISLSILLFATPLFIYSLLLVPHVLTACLIYFAFRMIHDPQRIFLRYCLPAGLLCGLALLCNPSSLVCTALLCVSILLAEKKERLASIGLFLLGVIPFALVLSIYDYLLFGSPFAHIQAELGFSFQFSNFYQLLISPKRGLLFYSPILLLAILLFFVSSEKKTMRHRVKIVIILLSTLFFCLQNQTSDYPTSDGLILILPLLLDSFFDGELYDRSNIWVGLLFMASFIFCLLPSFSLPIVLNDFKYPHNTFWLKLLTEQRVFTPNLLTLFGFENMPLQVSVAVVLALFALYFTWTNMRKPYRFLVGALIGILLVVTYLLLPNLDKPNLHEQRQRIVERYF